MKDNKEGMLEDIVASRSCSTLECIIVFFILFYLDKNVVNTQFYLDKNVSLARILIEKSLCIGRQLSV